MPMRLPAVASIRGLLPAFSALLAAGVLLGAGWAGTASALTIDPNPVSFDNGTVSGTITLIADANGVPSGGSVEVGSVDPSDISLVFQVSVTAGTLNGVGVSAFDTTFTAQPVVAGAGVIAGTGDEAVSAVGQSGSTIIFDFLSGGVGTLDAGEISDEFFVSYESLVTDGSISLNFMISPEAQSDFTVTSSVVVPEPATLLLAFAGLAGLLRASRRTR